MRAYVSSCGKNVYFEHPDLLSVSQTRKPLGSSNFENCLCNLTQPARTLTYAPLSPQSVEDFKLLQYDGRAGYYDSRISRLDVSPVNMVPKLMGKILTLESDEHKISQRAKQISYGKSTIGYQNYLRRVPKGKRDPNNENHPSTPRVDERLSKRNWDGKLKQWRRTLHKRDLASEGGVANALSPVFDSPSSSCGSLSSEASNEEPCTPKKLVYDEVKKQTEEHSWASQISMADGDQDLEGFECVFGYEV